MNKARQRQKRKLRHWADEVKAKGAKDEVVRQVIARLEGRVLRYYVLARSATQFEKWWCELYGATIPTPDIPSAYYVNRPSHLRDVRLNSVVQLIELDGWEAVADDELKFLVRLLKATAK